MYLWSVYFHLIFITFWLGGMLFTVAVLVPATRKRLQSQKALLFTELGTRFSRLSWILFPFIILTGILALFGRGFTSETLLSTTFWQSSYGSILQTKLIYFGLMLLVSALHDFWLGPKAAILMQQQPEIKTTKFFQKLSRWGGRINLILGLIILYYAVALVRGG